MGAQLSGSVRSAGSRGGRRRSFRPNSEPNVTPFVDVMLVLLIVFMVAAPLMTVGVPVDLPKTNAAPLPVDKEPLIISIRPDGTIYVQETAVELANLVALLTAVTGANPEARILVRGDQKLAYGRMLEVMGAMSGAGFKKVGLVADLPSPTKSGR